MKQMLKNWWPAVLLMAVIFGLSSQPSGALPNFGWADTLVKKGGHLAGYGALSVSYWRAFGWKASRLWPAWVLAVVYGMSDELHQILVSGRHASAVDVFLFDSAGAVLGLWLVHWALQRSASGTEE